VKSGQENHGESGFSLIELLVVILIIGILAAIAIPSFLNQKGKGDDAEAKSVAVSAAKAMEICSTDQHGTYTGCSMASLLDIESTLRDAGSRLDVTPGTDNYLIVVTSKRDSNAATFSISRSANGSTNRVCETGAADKGGCSSQSSGDW
jgi:type IV pilus assembly protein PilA